MSRIEKSAAGRSENREIDSEDDAWDGSINPTAFQQVQQEQERARIIARLEAQNRSAVAPDRLRSSASSGTNRSASGRGSRGR
mmetsp:Transcript_74457/g.206795  ORF Transcript_74457/g.206795 Transcript_74457/m.206795 type:complete len:83 (-) Transcript_74457:126-374(-)